LGGQTLAGSFFLDTVPVFRKRGDVTNSADKFTPKMPPNRIESVNEPMSVEKLAEDHVDWFLEIVRPLMITEFMHGYKHGRMDRAPGAETKN